MANRTFRPFQATKREVKRLYFKFTFATDTATLSSDHNGFVTSVTRNAEGQITVVLADKYNELLAMSVMGVNGALNNGTWHVHTDLATGNTIILGHTAGTEAVAPALQDPTDGTYKVTFDLKNSSVR